ncbi:hypothetical protein [Kosmotoga pacifica]|uniref:hypothetical protein n=1 Tax=Kosmotoga pacifica TaxID=1330330 RepID=UPI001C54D452|nr:hypothetical protein [Kosmotoga pacifica]
MFPAECFEDNRKEELEVRAQQMERRVSSCVSPLLVGIKMTNKLYHLIEGRNQGYKDIVF